MNSYDCLMPEENNQLLGYTIDKLIKAFNPYRKERMNKFHFYKLMNLLDYRLQKARYRYKITWLLVQIWFLY